MSDTPTSPNPSLNETPSPQPLAGRPRRTSQLGAVILLVLGVVFLLQNTLNLHFGNWWAMFIMIAGAFSLANAWRDYTQSGGRLSREASTSAVGGVVLLVVASVFLFNLSWGSIWSAFLILAGLSVMLAGDKAV